MRVTTLKSESTLRELSVSLYGRLDADTRKRAEAALLKANPQLAASKAFRPGAVVVLPEVTDLRARADTLGQDPIEELREALAGALASYREHLTQRADELKSDLAQQTELLKDRDVSAAIKKDAAATELARQLAEALRARDKTRAEDRKRQEATLEKTSADLKALKLP
jgi:phage tail protein X